MENIKLILKKIEADYNVRIRYACETGSRAWGFPSPDSDFDIRFIYQHERDWYLSLGERKDTIEFMDGDLDITGWDLRKCLRLLKKSNVPLIERFQSLIIYYADDSFADEFKHLIEAYYSPTASFYHHYSLATKFWETIKEEAEIKLKNYFYLVRSLLSCNWIIRDKAVLPMHIEGLMVYSNETERQELRNLIALKSTVGEKYLHRKSDFMQKLVTDLFAFIDSNKNNLAFNGESTELLDNFFLKQIL